MDKCLVLTHMFTGSALEPTRQVRLWSHISITTIVECNEGGNIGIVVSGSRIVILVHDAGFLVLVVLCKASFGRFSGGIRVASLSTKVLMQVSSTHSTVPPGAAVRRIAIPKLNPHCAPFVDTVMLSEQTNKIRRASMKNGKARTSSRTARAGDSMLLNLTKANADREFAIYARNLVI